MRSGGSGSIRLWIYPILLAGVALGFDAGDRLTQGNVLSTGLFDEVSHLATAALGLLVLTRFLDVPRRFYVAALVASVAIDLDHIPLYLGLLGNQDQRPITHSFASMVIFVGAAAASRRHRAVLSGAAAGLLLHFARDIAEGPPGVRMFWPLQGTAWTANYWWFLGMILALTIARLVLVSVGIPHRRATLLEPYPHFVRFLMLGTLA
jgi:inner membrane protein